MSRILPLRRSQFSCSLLQIRLDALYQPSQSLFIWLKIQWMWITLFEPLTYRMNRKNTCQIFDLNFYEHINSWIYTFLHFSVELKNRWNVSQNSLLNGDFNTVEVYYWNIQELKFQTDIIFSICISNFNTLKYMHSVLPMNLLFCIFSLAYFRSFLTFLNC